MRSRHVSASDTQSADSYLRSRTIPIASPPCPPSRAFVQSGFNEVALSAKPRRHRRATSQNPPDSQIGRFLIHHAGWDGGQHGWASLTLWIFANVLWQRLRAACPAIRQPSGLGSRSARQLAGCSESMRPAALLPVRWAVTSRRRFQASKRPGYRSGSEPPILPCAGSLPSLPGVD